MKISLIQTDIVWEDKARNLALTEEKIASLSGKTDLVILPEMFSTGFSMNSHNLAEANDGSTVSALKLWAQKYKVAICGSHIGQSAGKFFNRGFFITPDAEYYYDKKHLFRMGEEPKHFEAGHSKLIVNYKDFRICLQICYDLRFPVWSRNVDNEYDLLIYVASWPVPRIHVWDSLLVARAIENMAYVCGVNRIGTDGNGLNYSGGSRLIDAKGKILSSIQDGAEQIETIEISKAELDNFRQKFPVWKDADSFTII
ncbi:omega-amidase [Dysgonomonas sp. PH5-45]|uniref:amidohydrolase n=1 Tax=unclassified Dysgonomonas TaxID=2630389 RepID=UPI0024751DF9|nr:MULTISPECIES: amidohydrolase [unclassified Dysgonomonas]MDH6355588.1 omega-amidase [Dysgonomonas sp. PH5-45]MDH6388502.1 omega-amidase [Dysgonomonas sp. PH5-37]